MFHQFGVEEASRDFTSFSCPITGRRFRWKRCYFGLKNIPTWVSYIMLNRVLKDTDPSKLSCYIDDLSAYTSTHTEMLITLEDVFLRMRSFNLKFRGSKCSFGYFHITQFGYRISREGLEIDPSRIEKLLEIKKPANRKQLATFLGASGYYRSNIENFAKFTSTLTPMLQLDKTFLWNTESDQAWLGLLSAIKQSIILAPFDPDKEIIITTDASEFYHGGTLSQEHNGNKYLIAVYSQHWPKQMIPWSINIKELAGAVRIVEHFNDLCIGKTFVLRTDSSWTYFTIRNADRIFYSKNGPALRLILRLSKYSFRIEHLRGDNSAFLFADTMSRLNITEFELSHKSIGKLLSPMSGQRATTYFTLPRIYSREEIHKYVKDEQLRYRDEIITAYSKFKQFNKEGLSLDNKLIVPKQSIPKVLRMIHRHYGTRRELGFLRLCDLRWDNMTSDLINYTKSCPSCQRLRSSREKNNVDTLPRGPNRPFQSVAIDVLQIGVGLGSAHFILGLICHHSNYVLLHETKSTAMKDCLDVLLGWVLMFNITEATIQSDNGFNKVEFLESMNLSNISARFGCPYNSRSNSRIERTFRSVSERIRVYELADKEIIFGFTPKQFLIEPLKPIIANNLQSYAKANYKRLLTLSNCIENYYGHTAEARNVAKSKLYPIGSQVRIIKNYPRGK